MLISYHPQRPVVSAMMAHTKGLHQVSRPSGDHTRATVSLLSLSSAGCLDKGPGVSGFAFSFPDVDLVIWC